MSSFNVTDNITFNYDFDVSVGTRKDNNLFLSVTSRAKLQDSLYITCYLYSTETFDEDNYDYILDEDFEKDKNISYN